MPTEFARRTNLGRIVFISFSALALLILCVSSVFVVYGTTPAGIGARLTARSLASAQISEMVGTNAYVASNRPVPHAPLTALMETFGVPLSNPIRMVEAQYPTAIPKAPSGGVSETSLMTPITTWAKTAQKNIAMGWIPSGLSASESINLIANNPGMNVVSPTWFELWSKYGTVKNFVQPSVVTYAHDHHVSVWALVDNQYSLTLTHELLANKVATNRFVRQLTQDAVKAHLDGINLDFENMDIQDESAYTNMVGQLHQMLMKHHIKLSVDITPDIVFLHDTDVYFHAGLAANADYLIVMAYDEHWASDTTPGPVADLPWVRTAVDDLLNTGVPADKLVLGVPFYTRFWHVYADGSVSSSAYANSQVQGILASHNAVSKWNPHLQLNYARYPKPNGYEEVWYFTPQTLKDELDLVNNEGLAGVAVWSLSFSDAHSWSVLISALRNSLS